jgi:MFS family permease
MFQRKLKVGYFVLAWLNIYATAYYGNYIFFLMKQEFGFGNRENLLMAAVNGGIYIFFAWFAGRFAQKRGYYLALKVGFSIMTVALLSGTQATSVLTHYGVMMGWTVGMCFTWPTLEALVSEGETRKGLTTMLGIYNVVWASGAAVSYFTGGALLDALGPRSLFWFPPILHAVQFAILIGLQRASRQLEPVTQDSSDEEPIDIHDIGIPLDRKKIFLRLAWIANPFAYIAMNTVIPLIPHIATRFDLSTTLAGFVGSVWMFARLFTFVGLWFWAGWHYRFRWLAAAYAVMVGCFAALLLINNLAVVIIAQLAFGLAVGLIYYSSLFYAMDVGETKGEHGGAHEALIGVGLCCGPAVGTIALRVVPAIPYAGTLAVSALLTAGLAVLLVSGGRLGRKGPGLAQKSLS